MCKVTLEYCACCKKILGLASDATFVFVQCKDFEKCISRTYYREPLVFYCEECDIQDCVVVSPEGCSNIVLPQRTQVTLRIVPEPQQKPQNWMELLDSMKSDGPPPPFHSYMEP